MHLLGTSHSQGPRIKGLQRILQQIWQKKESKYQHFTIPEVG